MRIRKTWREHDALALDMLGKRTAHLRGNVAEGGERNLGVIR